MSAITKQLRYMARQKPIKRSGLKRSKFGAVKTLFNGRYFASKGEAGRGATLEIMQRAGEIKNLRYQVKYSLDVNGVHIANYYADYIYEENGIEICEDFKGLRTPIYQMKKKLMLAVHGIKIRESSARDIISP